MRLPGVSCYRRCRVQIAMLGIALAACASRPVVPAADPQPDAAVVFADLEERLLGAPRIHIRYTATAEGAVAASLQGTLSAVRPRNVELVATGHFAGNSVDASMRSLDDTLEVWTGTRTNGEALPVALNDAVLVGLTRMGILHNVARLASGRSPDRAGGGVREWVTVTGVAFFNGEGGPRPGLVALRFDILVSGQRAGEATLWLDPASGLPVHRRQIVSFPDGQMVVTESYDYSFPER